MVLCLSTDFFPGIRLNSNISEYLVPPMDTSLRRVMGFRSYPGVAFSGRSHCALSGLRQSTLANITFLFKRF